MWRVLENIYNNAAKYAMEGTRIYADLEVRDLSAVFNLKNVSEQQLNITADELTERFIRGDISRSCLLYTSSHGRYPAWNSIDQSLG